MRAFLKFASVGALLLAAQSASAQLTPNQVDPNPDVVGPARRAVGEAAENRGAPAVEQRMENRQENRDIRRAETGNPNAAARANARVAGPIANPDVRLRASIDANADGIPDRWRYVQHNNNWWYYTPENQWQYYNNNAWNNYVVPPTVAPRYETNYRGPEVQPRVYYNNNTARRGVFGRRTSGTYNYTPAPYNNNYNNGYSPAPYSNGTPAGNNGANLGARIGGVIGPNAAEAGATIGGAIGSGVGNAAGQPTVQQP